MGCTLYQVSGLGQRGGLRADPNWTYTNAIDSPTLIEPIGFVMSREMLLGIKQRAERLRIRTDDPGDLVVGRER